MKHFILIASSLVVITSCNNQGEKELVRSNQERDSLLVVANQREASVNEFIASFNEFERNLDSVAVKQHVIYINTDKQSHELQVDKKDRINAEIASINSLMKQNSEKIAELKRRLKNSIHKNNRLEEAIATLNNQLMQKNVELDELNKRLSALDVQIAQLKTSIDTLTAQNSTSAKTIEEETRALHTAYYVIGKTKELQEAKLIDRKGGILGVGRTSKLSENFDKSKFIRIDYTQTGSIPINSDRVKIITTHPNDSYTLDKDSKDKDRVKNLVITNPEKFWSASKYLVIVKG